MLKVIAIILWAAFLVGSVSQGLSLVSLPMSSGGAPQGVAIVLTVVLPLLFFSAMPIWTKGNVFDVPAIRAWATHRFGDIAYERCFSSIRPMLLLTIANLVLGIVGFANAFRLSAPEGAYVLSAFFISAAGGLAICRFILARQGRLHE
ncbi:MAG: hypothetical protein ABL891_02265 [Burkholderiales bacterium]